MNPIDPGPLRSLFSTQTPPDHAEEKESHPQQRDGDLEDNAQRFEQALGGEENSSQHEKNEDENDSAQSQMQPAFSPGDALLRAMFGGAPAVPIEEKSNLTNQEPKLAALASEVAERVLVSDPASGESSEVRIILKDSVLPQTEIRISRNAGEMLVQFVTQSAESAEWLAAQQIAVQELLQERLRREKVRVEIQRDARDSDENDASRGTRNPLEIFRDEEKNAL